MSFMGYQMQVDFGQKHMRTHGGKYIKVYFIAFVLSHSRYKWGYFLDRPFTTNDLIRSLDMCFEYMGGKPYELVFDQDSIVSVNENYGDIIYTYEFEKYKQQEQLKIFLCRKADPESKGKIESVVKYVKNSFLPNRFFMDLDILNRSFEEWLERTVNARVHGTTKKVPAKVFEVESQHLRPVLITETASCNDSITRKIRKDNTIIYESNRYSLPLGTYNREKEVALEIKDNKLIIRQIFGDYIIAEQPLAIGKGQLIKNTSHGRNPDGKIDELYKDISQKLDRECDDFLTALRQYKSRYFRDQCSLLGQLLDTKGSKMVKTAIAYCQEHELYSATDVKDTIIYFEKTQGTDEKPSVIPIRTLTNPNTMSIVTSSYKENK